MKFVKIAMALSLILLSSLLRASPTDVEHKRNLILSAPWIRLLPPTVMHTAGYVTINNKTDLDEVLLNVTSKQVDSLSVHQTKNVDGMMKMIEVHNLRIPAHGKIDLAPGGYHLMLMGLSDPLVENQNIPITFEFKNTGKIDVIFPVIKK